MNNWTLRVGLAWERFRDWTLLQWTRTILGAVILWTALTVLDIVLRAVVLYW